jgi:hypothetical protein
VTFVKPFFLRSDFRALLGEADDFTSLALQ